MNMNTEVECPLCTQIGFQSVDALRIALVSAASRNLTCPVCNASLTGLDKLTVHLFGHTLHQHELHSVGLSSNNDKPSIDTPMTQSSVPKPIILTSQDSIKKIEVPTPCTIPLQNLESFQNDGNLNKASEPTASLNQDLSNLLCWFPLTFFQDKLPNPAIGNFGSAHCDLLNTRTPLHNQQNDGKTDRLGTAENNAVNKDASFIIVSLPSLQDMKKQVPNSNCSNTDELSLSDVTSLSGKLLMLDCSGNSQCNNNVSVNNSTESSVQISLPNPSSPHSTSVNTQPPNQNSLLPNREITNTVTSCNMKDDDVEKNKQSGEGGAGQSTPEIFRCTSCFLQFTDSNILSLHQQLVHEGSNSLQSRLTVPEKESTSNQEVDHIENKEEENFQCHLCSKTFHMQGSLMVHLRVAHATPTMLGLASRIKGSISDPPPASTASTPGMASTKNAKDQLQGKSTDNKQWECSDCGKFFTTKYFLKKHKRLHTGEMPYSCPTCSKSFTFQQSYHKHLLYHSDEKPHTCTECGRSFKELSTLHNHQRIHTGEKPWACETCGKCFRQRVSYLVHRRIHTGAMPYCCIVCNKSFRYKVSQRTHKCIVQHAGANTVHSGDLLEQLLFDQPEGNTSRQNQESKQVKMEKLTHEQEQTLLHQNKPEEVQPIPRTPQSKQQSSEQTQLLYSSLTNDKTMFSQRLEANSYDFSLLNFQLQQTGSNTQIISQNNVVMQNLPFLLKDDIKQSVVSEKNRTNSTWCADKRSSPGQNTDLNPSSLVVKVNDKEMISSALPNPNVPVSLLQVLQKEKFSHEYSSHPSVSTNNLLSTAPCPDAVKVSNAVMSTPFVPDFLSMATSAPTQNTNPVTSCGNSNVPINNDPFHWEVSLDMPTHDHNDSITDNVSASQEAIDSLQSLLFGSPPTEL